MNNATKTVKKRRKGFTLAELLICLLILGEIATFTIPKIISAQQNKTFNAIAKEAAGTISAAYQLYQTSNTVSASTGSSSLTPYLNYISIQTTGNIDGDPGTPTLACDATNICLKLHNGSIIRLILNNIFGGTQTTRYIFVTVDPDGRYTGNSDSLFLMLYLNGRLSTHANRKVGELTSFGGGDQDYGPGGTDPSWFSWN
jgi:prepilin-type N-terminal cleavage/methylation domain-containing protein